MLLEMASVNPLAVFQLSIAIQYPSVASFALVPIAMLIGHVAINIRAMFMLAQGSRDIIQDCLSKGPNGTTCLVSELFAERYPNGKETYEDIEKWSVQFGGHTRRKLDEMVRIHVAPDSGIFTCYTRSQFFSSDIFVSSLPREREPLLRFIFLHELFHVLDHIVTRPITHIAAIPAHLVFFLWALCWMKWSYLTAVIFSVTIIMMLVWQGWNHLQSGGLRLSSEIVADASAIIYSSDSDLAHLRANKKLSYLCDDRMSLRDNSARLAALREHIEMALAGKRDELIERSHQVFSTVTPLTLLSLFVFSVILASFNVKLPTQNDLWIAIASLAALILIFKFTSVRYGFVRSQVDDALRAQFPQKSLKRSVQNYAQ
ncbi:MAG: hypothetical protein ABL950_15355 [Nitrospira sp.]